MRARVPAVLLFAVVTLAPLAARAGGDSGAPLGDKSFGDRGAFTFGGGFGVGGSQQLGDGYDTLVETHFGPSLDLFVLRHLSWGMNLQLAYDYVRSGGSSSLVQIAPRIGYSLPIGDSLVLWPRVGLALGQRNLDAEVPSGPGASSQVTFHHRIVSTTLYVPLHVFVLSHIAIGFGPTLAIQLWDHGDGGDHPRTTTLGADFEIAGWL
jgi:hypothetical protein